jgi:hypothetical protein
MDVLQGFLNALPTAATSPYAYAAYVLLLGSWLVSLWLRGQPQRRTEKILSGFRDDAARNAALANLLGESPPQGLPPEQILEWVRTRTRDKSKTYLLIGYVATLVTVIIIVVVALTLASSASPQADTPKGPTLRFAAVEAADCLSLPATARVTVSTEGAEPQHVPIAGCEARLEWAHDWRPGRQAHVRIEAAGAYERAEPDRTYRLGDAQWLITLRPTKTAPRLLVQVFDYAPSDAQQRQRFGQFQNIVRNKIQMLAESLAARHPECKYVGDLRIVRIDRQLASSPSEMLAEWRATNALAFFSGLVFQKEADIMVRSQPYFGELAIDVPGISRVQLDLKVDEQEFSQTTDSHSLALLYALAMDARRLGYSRDVVFTYLAEAVSVARGIDSTMPGIALLKRALRSSLEQMGAPVPEDL